jgi:membrane protein DedA with SNARE-associated domain
MPFAGYLASTGRFDLILVATAGAVGCNIGSAIAYAVGYHGGRSFVLRWGRYVFMSAHELARVEVFFARYGAVAVFIGRLLPVVRTFIALPAGMARMGQLKFHLYTFVGSWPWCFGLALIGYELGANWDSTPWLRAAFHWADVIVIAAVVLAAAWFVMRRSARRRPL